MSYRQQLESIFTDIELNVLEQMVSFESSTDTGSDHVNSMSAAEKRARISILDKINGKQNIRQSTTTPPSKL
jgi:hypothetical protein